MKKTNLDIINQESWNWVKHKKNQYNLRSVSNVIFKMIDEYRRFYLEKMVFLIQIEKYYEYSYFDLEEFSITMDLKKDTIIRIMDKYLGSKAPLFDLSDKELKEKTIKKIHDLMFENRILPRELQIAHYLKRFIDKNKLNISDYNIDNFKENNINIGVDNKLILSILFPDTEELRREVYCEAINFADWYIKNSKGELKCKQCDEDCFVKKPDYIYYKSGIDVTYEDLEDDMISDILKQHFGKHYLVHYGFCLIASIYLIIKRNLFMVRDFIEEELYLFKQSKEVLMFIKVLIQISVDETKKFAKEKDAFPQIFEKTSEYVKDIYHNDLITEEILI